MFAFRPPHGGVDAQPITDGCDFAEGHSGLHHAKRARVHPQKDHSLWAAAEFPQIGLMRIPSVEQWVIDIRNWVGKFQFIHRRAQTLRRLDELSIAHNLISPAPNRRVT